MMALSFFFNEQNENRVRKQCTLNKYSGGIFRLVVQNKGFRVTVYDGRGIKNPFFLRTNR